MLREVELRRNYLCPACRKRTERSDKEIEYLKERMENNLEGMWTIEPCRFCGCKRKIIPRKED